MIRLAMPCIEESFGRISHWDEEKNLHAHAGAVKVIVKADYAPPLYPFVPLYVSMTRFGVKTAPSLAIKTKRCIGPLPYATEVVRWLRHSSLYFLAAGASEILGNGLELRGSSSPSA
ncbi:uncharacterized protein VTP21DRAFT_11295 [Calcarisporiella thermophila]|uniref:uncharacterized protein n=1 Tax=Calcarisporiella thermophila TaxID=911321 RepID=UPI0037435CBC